jgi:hypothetical protein
MKSVWGRLRQAFIRLEQHMQAGRWGVFIYDPFAPVQMAILISMCLVFWAWILIWSFTRSSDKEARPRTYSGMTEFEARQRGYELPKKKEG